MGSSIKEKITDYILDEIISRSGEKLVSTITENAYIKIWGKCFEETTKNFAIFEPGVAARFSEQRGILRYCYATFENNAAKVTVENLAIAIAMEFESYGQNDKISYSYDLAEAVLNNWVKNLKRKNSYKDKFEDQISQITFEKNSDQIQKIEEILISKNKLYKAYFESYDHSNSSTKIKVYYPRPNETWIAWDDEYSVDINVNPMIGFELGFFKSGFDYKHINKQELEGLLFVYYLKSSKREGASFRSISIGERTGNIIWAH